MSARFCWELNAWFFEDKWLKLFLLQFRSLNYTAFNSTRTSVLFDTVGVSFNGLEFFRRHIEKLLFPCQFHNARIKRLPWCSVGRQGSLRLAYLCDFCCVGWFVLDLEKNNRTRILASLNSKSWWWIWWNIKDMALAVNVAKKDLIYEV